MEKQLIVIWLFINKMSIWEKILAAFFIIASILWLLNGFSNLEFKEQLTALGAFITAVIAIWRLKIADENKKIADKTLQTEEKKELHERYARAVELLKDENDAVRMGGLYSLQQISEENEVFFEQCKEIIAGYVRNRLASKEWKESKAKWEEEHKQDNTKRRTLPEDVRTGINILSILANSKHFKDTYINLQGIDLSGVDFSKNDMVFLKLDFSNSDFSKTKFRFLDYDSNGTNFITCRFNETNFFQANLSNATFGNLQYTNFKQAYLVQAKFTGILWEVNFTEADLSSISFSNDKIWRQNSTLNRTLADKCHSFLDKNEIDECLKSDINNKYELIDLDKYLIKNPSYEKILNIHYKTDSSIYQTFCVIIPNQNSKSSSE